MSSRFGLECPGSRQDVLAQPRVAVAARDVLIVGGGLSGALAAGVLARAGCRVSLFDLHAPYPPEFRAEQIVGEQADMLRRLGLFDAVAAGATPVLRVLNGRAGRVVDWTDKEHYGLSYDAMVEAARGAMPDSVEVRIGRVAALEAGPERQRVVLGSGEAVEGRLLVLATGLGTALRDTLGIARRIIRDGHSLTLGFDLDLDEAAAFRPFTYYGSPEQRIDYLTVFPLKDTIRANLFVYREVRDPWIARFRADPAGTLQAVLPGVERFLGRVRAAGPVQVRLNHLHAVEGHVRDGVVVIGDAFQTSCPAAGTGIGRLLTDVDRLREHVPGWLATPGMDVSKIAAFYADPEKTAFDAHALHVAHYMRAAATETGLRWSIHRQRVLLRRRLSALAAGHG